MNESIATRGEIESLIADKITAEMRLVVAYNRLFDILHGGERVRAIADAGAWLQGIFGENYTARAAMGIAVLKLEREGKFDGDNRKKPIAQG